MSLPDPNARHDAPRPSRIDGASRPAGRRAVGPHTRARGRRVLAVAALALATSLGLPAAPAHAVDNGEWAVVPTSEGAATTSRSSFAFDVAAGQSLEDSVTVQNLSDRTITFQIYAADGFTGPEGGYAVHGPDDPRGDVGSWVHLAADRWELPAGMQVEVPFVITVPADATPGDHAGGIAALDVDATPVDGGDVQLTVRRAVAVPVFVRVNGPLQPSLRVRDVAVEHAGTAVPGGASRTTLSLTIVNDGNVRMSPEVEAELDAMVGPGDHRFEPQQVTHLLPGAEATLHFEWDGAPAIGPATARVRVLADDVELERSTTTWTVPWLPLGALAVLVLGLLGARRWTRRRRTTRLLAERDGGGSAVRAPDDGRDSEDDVGVVVIDGVVVVDGIVLTGSVDGPAVDGP
jgi:hypothetical protein